MQRASRACVWCVMLGLFVWYGGFVGAAGAHVVTTNDPAVSAVSEAATPSQPEVCVVQIMASGAVLSAFAKNPTDPTIAVLVPPENATNVPVSCQDLTNIGVAAANQEAFPVSLQITVFTHQGAALCTRGPFTLSEHGARGVVFGSDCSVASATVIVVPNHLAAVEGNINNGFPFNIGDFDLSSQRYQQVFAASEFPSLSEPHFITQIAFRPDASFGRAFASTLSHLQINLSTTRAAPDHLSTTFAKNVGTDDTVVFSGSLSLASAFTGPAAGPKDFDILIPLQTPFLYDPAAGNLLLDVRNFAGGTTTQFDAEFTSGDPVSRTASYVSGSVNSPTANFSDSLGLVAQFTLTSAAVQAVGIEPSNLPNSINPRSQGVIP